MGVIYKATNTLNGTSYIGATRLPIGRRRQMHEYDGVRGKRNPFHSALREHGAEVFTWSVIQEVPNEELGAAESQAILAARKQGDQLYNICDGPGKLGTKHSPETRVKCGAKNKGRRHSDEARAKMKGRVSHNKGKHLSEETRAKLSAARTGKLCPQVFVQGKSYAEWAAELGVSYTTMRSRIQRTGSPYPSGHGNTKRVNPVNPQETNT